MNPYEILRISNNATLEQIKRVFLRRARETRPDLDPDHDSSEEFNRVVDSYNILSDPVSRRELDEMLQQGYYNESYTSKEFHHSNGYRQFSSEEVLAMVKDLWKSVEPATGASFKSTLGGIFWLLVGIIIAVILFIKDNGTGAVFSIVGGVIAAIQRFSRSRAINKKIRTMEAEIWDQFLSNNG